MVCGCPNCGQLMVHRERGIESMCICPYCLTTCDACLGNTHKKNNAPKTKPEIAHMDPMEFDTIDFFDDNYDE